MLIDGVQKALKYIINIKNENYIKLDSLNKLKEENHTKTNYSTLLYDNRIKNCDIIIEALEKQIPYTPQEDVKVGYDYYCKCGTYLAPNKCEEIKYCISCGQRIDWNNIKGRV